AMITHLAIKYRSIAHDFRFEQLRAHHMAQLMDLSKGFLADEPLAKATGCTLENTRAGMEYIFAYSIAANSVTGHSSMMCYENKTNTPVGILLIYPSYRETKFAPFSVPEPTLSKQEKTIFSVLDETWSKMWDIYPNENVCS
ncbi:hypothetical protein PMAYCL1PPCAC_31114, partial [Pristionchus mayeri]